MQRFHYNHFIFFKGVHKTNILPGEAGGGAVAPLPTHWQAEYRKYHVFSTFETNFYTEIKKTAPPLAVPNLGEDLGFLYLVLN